MEFYTVENKHFTDINLALIESAKTGSKLITNELCEHTAEIDEINKNQLVINDEGLEAMHVFELSTTVEDEEEGYEVVGEYIACKKITIYGKDVDKINFTKEFKQDILRSAEIGCDQIMNNI